MSWTAPRTFVTGELETASIFNTHLRDNLLETAPAKVTTKGDSVWGTGANAIVRLGVGPNGEMLIADSGSSQGVKWTSELTVDEASREVVVGDGTGRYSFSVDAAAGQDRSIFFKTAGVSRWKIIANNTAEGGSDAGSDLEIVAFDDSGVTLRSLNPALYLNRAQGWIGINETANANMTSGLTINQLATDDEIVSLKSSDVAHSFTSETEADTYGRFQKQVATEGGLIIDGFSEGSSGGIVLAANNGAGITTKGNASLGGIALVSFLISGSARGSHNANENLLVVRENATTVWIVDAEGDTHRDGTSNTFDDHDDVQLIRALDHALSPARLIKNEFDDFLKYNRDDLIEAGILSEGNFLNESQLLRLHSGAFWQMSEKIHRLEEKLNGALALLGAGG